MTSAEKIKFVNDNASVEYFDKDAELYWKLFPASRLNAELARANQYNKLHLDGRVLLEILEVVCGETVLENRGIVKSAANEGTFDIERFKQTDLAAVSYNDQKKMIKALNLVTDNQKSETLLAALKVKQDELNQVQKPEASGEPADTADVAGEDVPTGDPQAEDGQKKSEAPE